MSSTNKTKNLELNSWIGSDKPQRVDFNNDNEIIDTVITEHKKDSISHITAQEREKWNSFVKTGLYYGNGASERTITFDCDFDVSLIIIFAGNRPFSAAKFSDSRHYNYSAFISVLASSLGARFGSDYKSFIVNQSASALYNNEYASLNESGVAYTYILLR